MLEAYDIAIVGAGAIGAALACDLMREAPHLRIALIEANPESPAPVSPDRFDLRVAALSPKTVQYLRDLELWSAIEQQRLCAYRSMVVWDGQSTGAIDFHAADIHTETLGYIVENTVLLHSLHRRLEQNAAVQWFRANRLASLAEGVDDSTPLMLTLETGEQLTAELVVAADGAHSSVRQLAGFTTREWDYGQTAIITTVQTEMSHQHTAWQCFTPHGALAFLPLPDRQVDGQTQHYCSIVWSLNDDVVTDYMGCTSQEFCRHLELAFEQRLGRVLDIDERCSIPLRQRHARTYSQPRIALIGDAAHTVHPLAGQGMNLGFYDAMVLSEEVRRAVHRGYSLGEPALLKRYERRRKGHNLAAMAGMELFKRLFGSRAPGVVALRSAGLNWTRQQAWLKRYFIEAAAGEANWL